MTYNYQYWPNNSNAQFSNDKLYVNLIVVIFIYLQLYAFQGLEIVQTAVQNRVIYIVMRMSHSNVDE